MIVLSLYQLFCEGQSKNYKIDTIDYIYHGNKPKAIEKTQLIAKL